MILISKNIEELMEPSLMAHIVKNLPAMQEMQVRSLSQEESPQVAMTTISSIPARRIPWRVELSRLQSIVSQRIKRE